MQMQSNASAPPHRLLVVLCCAQVATPSFCCAAHVPPPNASLFVQPSMHRTVQVQSMTFHLYCKEAKGGEQSSEPSDMGDWPSRAKQKGCGSNPFAFHDLVICKGVEQ